MIASLEIFEAGLGAALVAGLGAGGYAYAANWPSSQIFGRTLTAPRNRENGPGEIALTFDDGPHPRWTPMLMEILAQHGVRATFFLVGKYASTQRPLVREMHSAGHLIGNHTWTHPNLAITGVRRTREELTHTKTELEQILGTAIRYFRPPFGARRPATLRIARELGMTPAMWNAMTADWDATESKQVTPKIASLIDRNQAAGFATSVVLHDGSHRGLEVDRSASVAAAGELLARFNGSHRFVGLDHWEAEF